MKFLLQIFFCFIFIDLSSQSFAEIGVGTVADRGSPGLSLQKQFNHAHGAHFAAHVFEQERVMFNGDYQRFFFPLWAYFEDANLSFYTGIGLNAILTEEDKTQEHIALRLPLGAQLDLYRLFANIFSDVSLELGALPETKTTISARVGLRAVF